MTKLQIETATAKELETVKSLVDEETWKNYQGIVQQTTNMVVGRICLELAREGYKFEKQLNWKPL